MLESLEYITHLNEVKAFKYDNSLDLQVSNQYELLLLCSSLIGNNSRDFEKKFNSYLEKATHSKRVFLVHLNWSTGEAIVKVVDDVELYNVEKAYLPPEVFDNLMNYEDQNNSDTADLHPNIQALLSSVLGKNGGVTVTVPIFCPLRKNLPICENRSFYPAFLVCLINCNSNMTYAVRLVVETFRFCSPLFLNTLATEEELRLKQQAESLLYVARNLFTKLHSFNALISDIINEAKIITNAEKCSVFLVDEYNNELVAEVFDTDDSRTKPVRFPQTVGIAGYVSTTGKLLNIQNPYENPLFNKEVDKKTGFVTKNILCVPISDEEKVIGVAQLCNKKKGYFFDEVDEKIATAFAVFCGLSIQYSTAYQRISQLQTKNKLANELLMYQMKVTEKEVKDLMRYKAKHQHPDLDKLYFNPRDVIFSDTNFRLIQMMEELNIINYYQLRMEVLCRFLLYVQKSYRNVPYHNFYHAFSVAHFAYLCLKNFDLVEKKYISKLEGFALFISCLCHDIDHRGTTNSFQQVIDSPLSNLYSSVGSILERHHLSQSICIINRPDCNILSEFNTDEYKKFLNYMTDMILATDLMTHFKHLSHKTLMIKEGYQRNNPFHRYNLISLLMTCADLNDQTKKFAPVKYTAMKVMTEFFNQGDYEKQLGKKPMAMMDRDLTFVPYVQIGFINFVCLPIFKMLVALFPTAMEMLLRMKRNVIVWEAYGKILMENGHSQNSLQALNNIKYEYLALSAVRKQYGSEF